VTVGITQTASAPSATPDHLQVLDGWRGLSILAVLACHQLPLGPKSWGLNEPMGVLGMVVFFTLSGFLITSFLLRGHGVGDFLIRRICRIVPLAWLGLIVGLWMAHAGRALYLPNFLFYANLPPFHLTEVTAHFWSLGVEVQFYLTIALVYGVLGRRGLLVIPVVALAVTALRISAHEYVSIVTWLRVDEILAGGTLALLCAGEFGKAAKSALGWSNPYLLLVLLLASTHPAAGPLNYLRPYIAALLVGRTLIGPATAMHAPLRSRLLAYIAAISYALYVVHPLLGATWLGSGSTIVKYAKRPLLIMATFGVAHLSTFYYESRWIALGKRLSTRRRKGAAIPVASAPGGGGGSG
jgi:peptidoglycan/LPS O-acetylase OafA/YrhL